MGASPYMLSGAAVLHVYKIRRSAARKMPDRRIGQSVSTLFRRDRALPRAALSFFMMLEHDSADQHTKRVVMRCNENDYLDS